MKLWIGTYHHRHGVDVYPFWQTEAPTEDQFIAEIELGGNEFEPDRDEWCDVAGPFEIPAFAE